MAISICVSATLCDIDKIQPLRCHSYALCAVIEIHLKRTLSCQWRLDGSISDESIEINAYIFDILLCRLHATLILLSQFSSCTPHFCAHFDTKAFFGHHTFVFRKATISFVPSDRVKLSIQLRCVLFVRREGWMYDNELCLGANANKYMWRTLCVPVLMLVCIRIWCECVCLPLIQCGICAHSIYQKKIPQFPIVPKILDIRMNVLWWKRIAWNNVLYELFCQPWTNSLGIHEM